MTTDERPTRQWVAYRVVPGAMHTAPLPSALDAGDGWRAVDLRRSLPLEQLDPLVIETGARSEAALGVHVEASFAYAIATARGMEPIRLILGTTAAAGEPAEAAFARAGASGHDGRWRRRAAEALEEWSAQAPRPLEASAVLALMGPEHPPSEAVSWLAALLGIRVPSEPIPDPLDLQSLVREQLGDTPPEPVKRRRFSRGG